jgi:hypothetical protein
MSKSRAMPWSCNVNALVKLSQSFADDFGTLRQWLD